MMAQHRRSSELGYQQKLVLRASRLAGWSVLFLAIVPAWGQKTTTSLDTSGASAVSAIPFAIVSSESSPLTEFEQAESEAVAFVTKHHPELVSLLQLLKAMREKEYETAIREIIKAQKRLETLAKREPVLHDIELDAWKVQSKIDLLLAQGYANDKAFNKSELRKLVKQQVEVQKKRLKHEEANLAKRQAQIGDLLKKLDGHEEERVEQQFASLMKRVDAQNNKSNKTKTNSKSSKESKTADR